MDNSGSDIHLEGGGPGPDRQGSQLAAIQAGAVPDNLLQHHHQHRGLQLPQGGPRVQEGVLLLPPHHLRPLLHVGHSVLGQLLVGQPLSPRPSRPWRHHPAHHVHTGLSLLSLLSLDSNS